MRLLLILLVMSFGFQTFVHAKEHSPIQLEIGTKLAPPFTIQNQQGVWEGLSIELWQEIEKELAYSSSYHDYTLNDLIQKLKEGEIDVAVAALTVTKDRETQFDFTHPFFVSGLGIATSSKSEGSWFLVLSRLISEDFIKVIAILFVILLLTGLLIWVFERRHNPDQFPENPVQGIGAGLWWSAVTMTTVGYGDKAPLSIGGRLVALIWMFAGLIFISSFTAAITTALTVDELGNTIASPKDLVSVTSGAVTGSTSQKYLEDKHYQHITFADLHAALLALKQNKIQAVVHDKPILSYQVSKEFKSDLHVLDFTFQKQYYAFGLQQGSQLREPINQVLLDLISKPDWKDLQYKYLGNVDD